MRWLFPVVISALLIIGCSALQNWGVYRQGQPGDFALYLPQDDQLTLLPEELSQIELSDAPLLAVNEILSYAAATHEIEIDQAVVARWDALELPGKRFIVTVGDEPIYAGTFLAAYFSRSDNGVVILWPPTGRDEHRLQIQLGYPGSDFFVGEDPRADPRVFEALRQAGKLK